MTAIDTIILLVSVCVIGWISTKTVIYIERVKARVLWGTFLLVGFLILVGLLSGVLS